MPLLTDMMATEKLR